VEVSDHEVDELYWCAYLVALRLLGDSEEAKDCAQEAAARALSRWPKVAPFARPWVVRVSSNLAIGVLRRRGRVISGLPDVNTPGLADVLDGLAARLDVRAGLMSLPLRQRQVLVMRYIGDLSEEETARALSVSVASVKTHNRRGLDRLRRILAAGGMP
jgi:RNA polymerase sigma factor (sigma-70 family)